jgi:hypothetical protein
LHYDIFSENCIVSSSDKLNQYLTEKKSLYKKTRDRTVLNESKKVISKNISIETLELFLAKENEIYNISQFKVHPNILTSDKYLFNSLDFISDNYLTIIDHYISVGEYDKANLYLNRYFEVSNKNSAVLWSEYRDNLKNYISRMNQLTKNTEYKFIVPDNYHKILRSSKR